MPLRSNRGWSCLQCAGFEQMKSPYKIHPGVWLPLPPHNDALVVSREFFDHVLSYQVADGAIRDRIVVRALVFCVGACLRAVYLVSLLQLSDTHSGVCVASQCHLVFGSRRAITVLGALLQEMITRRQSYVLDCLVEPVMEAMSKLGDG